MKHDDLLRRLDSRFLYTSEGAAASLPEEAGDAIRELQAENARLQEALRKIIVFVENCTDYEAQNPHLFDPYISARAALGYEMERRRPGGL